jgi:hypothetical protein
MSGASDNRRASAARQLLVSLHGAVVLGHRPGGAADGAQQPVDDRVTPRPRHRRQGSRVRGGQRAASPSRAPPPRA